MIMLRPLAMEGDGVSGLEPGGGVACSTLMEGAPSAVSSLAFFLTILE